MTEKPHTTTTNTDETTTDKGEVRILPVVVFVVTGEEFDAIQTAQTLAEAAVEGFGVEN
jgi:hypothetical protein